jgi:acylaminoacyl-peptidase
MQRLTDMTSKSKFSIFFRIKNLFKKDMIGFASSLLPVYMLLLITTFLVQAKVGHAQETHYANDSLGFDLEHVFELEYAYDPQISPDGEQVVYVRTSMDKLEDRRRRQLWIVNSDGSGHRPLTEPGNEASQPRWSPSGDRIAYVSGADKNGAEIFVRWMEKGQTARLTQLDATPKNLSWSPDGTRLAFSMKVKQQDKPFARLPSPPKNADWAPQPKVIDKEWYRRDGAGYRSDGFNQLFVVSAEGGTPRQLTTGTSFPAGYSKPSWSPDGQSLIVSANRHKDWKSDLINYEIYRVDIESGSVTALTSRQGPDTNPAVSPEGGQIAYTGFDDSGEAYQISHLYVMNKDGSDVRNLTPDLDRSVQDPRWGPDGRKIFFLYNDKGTLKVATVTLDGERREITTKVGGIPIGRPYTFGSYSLANDGQVAFTYGTAQRPANVAVGAADNKSSLLTNLNDDLLNNLKIGAVENFTYKSDYDGKEIEGWIVKPPEFDPSKKYPLILEIHGGPYLSYGPYFSAEMQLYAAAGYVVLYTNPRGSAGYGEEFAHAIQNHYPGHDYDDLMSGVDAVLERGYVDEDRLFVTGGSGGGILTAWIVTQTDRFRAAASAKPIINQYSTALTTDGYPYATEYWHPAMPWENPDYYLDHSPISYVDQVTTPTMLLTGENDLRTPSSEAEQFYHALKLLDVETVMVRFPETSHDIAAQPSQLAAKAAHVLEWFKRHGGK